MGDSIYFEEEGEIPTIYVTQFVSSNFTWDAAGLTLRQMIEPFTSGDPVLRVTISIYLDETRLKKSETSICVRIPSWTASLGCHAYLNGKEIQVPSPGNNLLSGLLSELSLSLVQCHETVCEVGKCLLGILPPSLDIETLSPSKLLYLIKMS